MRADKVESSRETKAILVADMVGFSSVKLDAHIEVFKKHVIEPIANRLMGHDDVEQINTWGDAIFALFKNPVSCCRFALELRDVFQRDLAYEGLPKQLGVRVAVHQGLVHLFEDPVRKMAGALGREIVVAARIEPVVAPGQVWTTEQVEMACRSEKVGDLAFDSIGEVELPKGYGRRRIFGLRRPNDAKIAPPSKDSQSLPWSLRQYEDGLQESDANVIYKELLDKVTDEEVRQQITELYGLAAGGGRPL